MTHGYYLEKLRRENFNQHFLNYRYLPSDYQHFNWKSQMEHMLQFRLPYKYDQYSFRYYSWKPKLQMIGIHIFLAHLHLWRTAEHM